MADKKIINDLISFLNDTDVTKKLILMSLHLSMFELVSYKVINEPKNFFSNDIKLINGKLIACDETKEYIDNVKNYFPRDLYKSSAYWYKENKIIDSLEFDLLIKFRAERNDAAHEIINILFDSDYSFSKDNFIAVAEIYKKICLWWLKEVESTINTAFESIDRDTFDYESAIEPQLFPVKRLLDLMFKTTA